MGCTGIALIFQYTLTQRLQCKELPSLKLEEPSSGQSNNLLTYHNNTKDRLKYFTIAVHMTPGLGVKGMKAINTNIYCSEH